MGSAWEKVEGLKGIEVVMRGEKSKVAGLSGGITGKVYDGNWMNVDEAVDEVRVAASARWVKNDGGVGSDEIKSGFGFSEMSGNVGTGRRSEGDRRF